MAVFYFMPDNIQPQEFRGREARTVCIGPTRSCGFLLEAHHERKRNPLHRDRAGKAGGEKADPSRRTE